MASRTSRLGDAVAPALTGLSLAAGIAREATDAVPIVKQALGVVTKILALAEKIDKDREALHALAEKSSQLARRVKDVVGDEEPDPILHPSLERMRKAFQDVEAFMEKHVARNPLSRGLSYAFTVNRHVGQLSGSMENALQEIIAVSLLSVNRQAKATHLTIEEDARYDGDFRLVRDCEVDKLDLFQEDEHKQDGSGLLARYYRARFKGKVLVVRYCTRIEPQDIDAVQTTADTAFERMHSHDLILKEVSTVRGSHPHVAKIYGWGKGSIHSRFVLFKSGYRPPDSILAGLSDPITKGIHWAFKVLDAAQHLRRKGISWEPDGPPYTLDDNLEPTIGLRDKLDRIDANSLQLANLDDQVFWSTDPLWAHCPWKDVALADVQAALANCHNERLTNTLGTLGTFRRRRYVIPAVDVSQRRVLDNEIANGLLRLLETEPSGDEWRIESWMWAEMLLILDQNRSHQVENRFRVIYLAARHGPDHFWITGAHKDSERVVYDLYLLDIPEGDHDEVREMLGIPPLSEGEVEKIHRLALGGPGTYSAPE